MNHRPLNIRIYFSISIFLMKKNFLIKFLTRFLGISLCDAILAYRGYAGIRNSANRINISIKATYSLTNYYDF